MMLPSLAGETSLKLQTQAFFLGAKKLFTSKRSPGQLYLEGPKANTPSRPIHLISNFYEKKKLYFERVRQDRWKQTRKLSLP